MVVGGFPQALSLRVDIGDNGAQVLLFLGLAVLAGLFELGFLPPGLCEVIVKLHSGHFFLLQAHFQLLHARLKLCLALLEQRFAASMYPPLHFIPKYSSVVCSACSVRTDSLQAFFDSSQRYCHVCAEEGDRLRVACCGLCVCRLGVWFMCVLFMLWDEENKEEHSMRSCFLLSFFWERLHVANEIRERLHARGKTKPRVADSAQSNVVTL